MKRINLLIYITLITCFSLIGVRSSAQTNLFSEGFEGAAFPPTGWQNNLIDDEGGGYSGPGVWQQAVAGDESFSSYNDPDDPVPDAHTGTNSAGFNAWDIQTNGSADLVTPSVDLSVYPGGSNVVSFWYLHPDEGGNFSDRVDVYVSTTTSTANATLIGTATGEYDNWTQMSYTIPSTYTGSVYVIFEAVSSYGNDEFIDDVSVDHLGCTGTPPPSAVSNTPIATPICSGTTVTLNAADPSNGVPGIRVYWEQAPSASGPWVKVVGGSGATSYSYTTSTTLDTSMYFRMVDTCTYSQSSIGGTPFFVPVSPSTTIIAQPQNEPACLHNDATFTVSAIGTGLTYRWKVDKGMGFVNVVNNTVYSGATTDTLHLTGVTNAMNGYPYEVIITGTCGTQTSAAAYLSIGAPPEITSQSSDSTICEGSTAAFQVSATGISLSYLWQVDTGTGFHTIGNGGVYTGLNTSTLVVNNAPVSMDGYRYQVIVSGACNPVTSAPYTLHVNGLPTIVSQPRSVAACNGTNTSFTIHATGASLTYEWQLDDNDGSGFNDISDGSLYSGTATNVLQITGVDLTMSGYHYRAIIAGTCAPNAVTAVDTLTVNALPPAFITAMDTTTICPSDSVFFMGNTGTGYHYQWYINNTIIPGATRDTFKASPAGGYQVAVTNALGCVSFSDIDTVRHLPAPTSAITASGPVSFCQGDSVTLSALLNTGVTYAWKLNGNYISNDTNTSYSIHQSGTYTLLENNGICGTISAPVTVTASPIPQAVITTTGAATFCSGQTVTLHAPVNASYSYQWMLNGTPQSNTGNTFMASVAGNYSVQVTSGPGCSATSSLFPVSSLPSPAAAITPAGGTSICPGGTAILNANAIPNVHYQWYVNGNPIPAASGPAYAASAAGSYTLNVTGGNGCVGTSSPLLITALPGITATIASSGRDTICAPNSVTLYAVADTVNNPVYTWYADGIAQTNTADSFIATSTGNYSVQISNNAGCTATSTAVHVAAGIRPSGSIAYALPGSICGSNPALLQAPAGAYSYQWYLDSSLIGGAFSQYYQAAIPGNYSVVLSTPLGCNDTPAVVSITTGTIPEPVITQSGNQLCATGFVAYQWSFNNQLITGSTSSCANIQLPGGYSVTVTNTSGCSATSDVYDVLVGSGVANVNPGNYNIKLYPNPTSSVIYIDAPIPVNIVVMSIDGKQLMRADKGRSVNIEGLASGMYMISVYDQENNLLKTDKMVKN